MCNNLFFENRAICEIMWKNTAELGRPQMKIWLQIHTLRLCNSHCFSTATMAARKRLNITLYVHCLSCYFIILTNPLHLTTLMLR